MHNIAICDDSLLDCERIKSSVEDYFRAAKFTLPMIKFYNCGEDLVRAVKNKVTHDIIFLDINMGKMDGIEAAKEIRRFLPDVFIVLVTAFLEYSIEGYKIGVFRYIIKSNLDAAIKECLSAARQKFKVQRPLLLNVNEGIKWIKLNAICYIESDIRDILFHVIVDGVSLKYTTRGKLSDYEENSSFNGFIRTHKSYLVNPVYIDCIKRYSLRLKTGEELAVPKARFREVLERYTESRGYI